MQVYHCIVVVTLLEIPEQWIRKAVGFSLATWMALSVLGAASASVLSTCSKTHISVVHFKPTALAAVQSLWTCLNIRNCIWTKWNSFLFDRYQVQGALWMPSSCLWMLLDSQWPLQTSYLPSGEGRHVKSIEQMLCTFCFACYRLKENVGFPSESMCLKDYRKPWINTYKNKFCSWSKCCGPHLWWNMHVFPRLRPS